MLNDLLLFGGSVFFTYAVIIGFLVLCLISDIAKNGFVAFLSLIALAIVYRIWGDFHSFWAVFLWWHILVYLAIGLIYSSLRVIGEGWILEKRNKNVPFEKDLPEGKKYDTPTKESIKAERLEELKGNIGRWILLWWISMPNWLFFILPKRMWVAIFHFMRDFYESLLDLGMKWAR